MNNKIRNVYSLLLVVMFAGRIAAQNLLGQRRWNTSLTLASGRKPDLVDVQFKNVWELKPKTYHPWDGSYQNYQKGKKQIGDYVTEMNSGGTTLQGPFSVGGAEIERPFFGTLSLTSLDGTYQFTYSISNAASGLMYYKATKIQPIKVPVFDRVREFKPIGGYPGQGAGQLISDIIEYFSGKKVPIPDPVPVSVPGPVPVIIP